MTYEIVHAERGLVPQHPYLGPKSAVERIIAVRLIELEHFAAALAWKRWRVDAEIAGELWVDLDVLVTCVKNLTTSVGKSMTSWRGAAMNAVESMILNFERQQWNHASAKEYAIRATFEISPTGYYQMLNALLKSPKRLHRTPCL